jgi:hypothetical protein
MSILGLIYYMGYFGLCTQCILYGLLPCCYQLGLWRFAGVFCGSRLVSPMRFVSVYFSGKPPVGLRRRSLFGLASGFGTSDGISGVVFLFQMSFNCLWRRSLFGFFSRIPTGYLSFSLFYILALV